MRHLLLLLPVMMLGISIWGDILARRGEYGQWWYPVPGFFALLGFLGCVALVAGSKLLGHYWLQRGEDYYGDDNADE